MISTLIIQGFIFSLVAMAVYTTSRVIRKDDLSVEGSFSLGGSLTALMLEHSTSSCFTLAACLLIGALAGLCTGLLYSRLKMNHLMAGLTTTTACFSISLGLGSANKVVDSKHTIFESVHFINGPVADVGITAVIAVAVLLLIHSLLKSEIGLLLRATGENPWFVQSLGKSSGFYYCLGFCIANALVSLAGSLFVQWSLFFSITGSVGTLVTGLASLQRLA